MKSKETTKFVASVFTDTEGCEHLNIKVEY